MEAKKANDYKFDISHLNLHCGDFHALKDVNMKIEANKITAFIGPSGCGKSTFLKTLNRMNDLVENCKYRSAAASPNPLPAARMTPVMILGIHAGINT